VRSGLALVTVLLLLATVLTLLPSASQIPSVEQDVVFRPGTFVIPMDEKQADRIRVFGFVHALGRSPNPIQVFRLMEPPDPALSTDLTTSPKVFTGGPFLVNSSGSSKLNEVKNRPEFTQITVGRLTAEQRFNNLFRLEGPTSILVVKGLWGRTDMTLDEMKIPYDITTREDLAANPGEIFDYSLIVVDCYGWSGSIPSQVAQNIRSHVDAGNEVIFTDIALKDLDSTFSGYVNLWGPQPTDRVTNATNTFVHNPPRKYGSSDHFSSEFQSQYHDPPPHTEGISVFTESAGYVVSSIPSTRVNDVRILADSESYGATGDQYAILAFYFEYGDGIVEGVAFHPQQQTKFVVGENGYYAVRQLYGNLFVHRPSTSLIRATPSSASVPQGTSTSFVITVRPFDASGTPVTLAATGLPPEASYTFAPSALVPLPGGSATSIFTVTVPPTTPNGTYTLNVTGTSSSTPPIAKWVLVMLTVGISTETATSTQKTSASTTFSILKHVVINEFEQSPPSGQPQFLELFNPTSFAVDISGWVIYTTHGDIGSYTVPSGTVLEPDDFWFLQFPGDFIDSQTDSLVLLNAQGQLVDQTPTKSDTAHGSATWQRSPDGSDSWVFATSTPNTMNVPEYSVPPFVIAVTVAAAFLAMRASRRRPTENRQTHMTCAD